MLVCRNCGAIFDDDELETKSSFLASTGDRNFYEDIAVCPYCGKDNYEEAERCEECGEWFSSDELTDGLCVDCT